LGDKLAGFQMVLVNATKTQTFVTPWTCNECLLAALAFCSFYFSWECSIVYIAENFT
jgi:hypothetical protein